MAYLYRDPRGPSVATEGTFDLNKIIHLSGALEKKREKFSGPSGQCCLIGVQRPPKKKKKKILSPKFLP